MGGAERQSSRARVSGETIVTLHTLKQKALESPAWRTFFTVLGTIVSGVLSGSFVSEISTPHGLAWARFYASPSFYGLAVLSVIIYAYNRALYLHERDLSRFLDVDFCTAYMRSKLLPEAAERYKKLIRDGHGGELKHATDELREILK